MTKKHKHIHRLHLHIRPLHLHLGMYIAIAAIIVTALHTSADMVYALYGAQPVYAGSGNHEFREAREYETHVGHAQISIARRSYIGGM